MPTYEYRCEKCGHEFEREQRITEDPIKTCPKCKAPKARRLISATSFVLKGGGWYSDLYSSGSAKKAEKSGSESSSTSESKGDSGKAASSSSDGAKPKKTEGKSSASA
jgi:putative FmdB family regulatory protein